MLRFRYATLDDSDLYFNWANDPMVRKNSINTDPILLEDHVKWFEGKINNPDAFMYLFFNDKDEPVGQSIIEFKNNWVTIGQTIATEHRGKKYGKVILTMSTDDFLEQFPERTILSVIKASNIPSLKMSINSGFNVLEDEAVDGKVLILKGFKQHDPDYILEAKKYYKLI